MDKNTMQELDRMQRSIEQLSHKLHTRSLNGDVRMKEMMDHCRALHARTRLLMLRNAGLTIVGLTIIGSLIALTW